MLTPAATNLIAHMLGPVLGPETDPDTLRRRHTEDSAEGHLVALILDAALRLSDLEQNLRRRIASTAGILTRVTATLDAGVACNSSGELRSTGGDLDLLAARHADAHHWLIETLSAYRNTIAPQ
ncbi:hypothetical protein [Micromonospora sp. NBC_01813]|uniref:hypothetical protein n=1 Tax=Micromonospora sp. NBC_01813 TaxID=2975988 RepID=UPI002DD93D94|nr:hypothetical protein [Micromonospora sp. NBC_01813]WSA06986.1 hypothetical protein OG958_22335 [Micromonospora sp. NBC_01813]